MKCYAWEKPSLERIQSTRTEELGLILRSFVIRQFNAFILMATPTLVTTLTFIAYVLLGNDLTATKAFTSIALFALLRMPLFQLPMIIDLFIQAQVSVNRIQEFLLAAESKGVPSLPLAAAPLINTTDTLTRAGPQTLQRKFSL